MSNLKDRSYRVAQTAAARDGKAPERRARGNRTCTVAVCCANDNGRPPESDGSAALMFRSVPFRRSVQYSTPQSIVQKAKPRSRAIDSEQSAPCIELSAAVTSRVAERSRAPIESPLDAVSGDSARGGHLSGARARQRRRPQLNVRVLCIVAQRERS